MLIWEAGSTPPGTQTRTQHAPPAPRGVGPRRPMGRRLRPVAQSADLLEEAPVRYALISDIHANLPALEAVLRDISQRGASVEATYHSSGISLATLRGLTRQSRLADIWRSRRERELRLDRRDRLQALRVQVRRPALRGPCRTRATPGRSPTRPIARKRISRRCHFGSIYGPWAATLRGGRSPWSTGPRLSTRSTGPRTARTVSARRWRTSWAPASGT